MSKLLCSARDASISKKVRRAMDDVEFSGWIQLESAQPHGLIPDYTDNAKYLWSIFSVKV